MLSRDRRRQRIDIGGIVAVMAGQFVPIVLAEQRESVAGGGERRAGIHDRRPPAEHIVGVGVLAHRGRAPLVFDRRQYAGLT